MANTTALRTSGRAWLKAANSPGSSCVGATDISSWDCICRHTNCSQQQQQQQSSKGASLLAAAHMDCDLIVAVGMGWSRLAAVIFHTYNLHRNTLQPCSTQHTSHNSHCPATLHMQATRAPRTCKQRMVAHSTSPSTAVPLATASSLGSLCARMSVQRSGGITTISTSSACCAAISTCKGSVRCPQNWISRAG